MGGKDGDPQDSGPSEDIVLRSIFAQGFDRTPYSHDGKRVFANRIAMHCMTMFT